MGRRVWFWATAAIGGALLAPVMSGCGSPSRSVGEGVAAASRPSPLVVILTDFGNRDFYVGVLKGVVYARCPGARVDGITQQIQPFDVRQGARVLRQTAPFFPAGTVFLAVVDPGVGGPRRPIVCRTRTGHVYVGPDNGVLWPTLQHEGIDTVWHITNAKLLRAGAMSSTFHGRDVFAPIAAYAACGGDLSQVGPTVPTESLVRLTDAPAERIGNEVRGQVLEVDRYGNVLTNIPAALVAAIGVTRGQTLRVHVGAAEWTAPLVKTYSDVAAGKRLALINSEGHLELAINRGNLVAAVGAASGQSVRVAPGDAPAR